MRYLKKAEGAISIFLCIILISVILLSSVLVEGSRMKTAETQIQSALDSASKSALACYNNLLKDMYGLMALSDDDPSKLMEEVYYYLERNLHTSGIEEYKTISEKTMDEINGSDTIEAIKNFLGIDSKSEKPPLDLYGFEIESLEVKPIYNLSEPEVLRAQILEYMKYRAPKQLAEGLFDKFMAFKDFKKQADILSEKLDVDKSLDDIRQQQIAASDNIVKVNKFTDFNLPNQFEIAAGYIKERTEYEKDIQDINEKIDELEDDIDHIREQIKEIEAEVKKEKEEGETAEEEETDKTSGLKARINELEKDISELKNSRKDAEKKLDEKKKQLKEIKNTLISKIDETVTYALDGKSSLNYVVRKSKETAESIDNINAKLEGENNEFSQTTRVDIGKKKKTISSDDLAPKIQDLEYNVSTLSKIKNFILNGKMDTLSLSDFGNEVPDIDDVKSKLFISEIQEQFNNYKGTRNNNAINYYVDKGVVSSKKKEGEKDPRDVFKDLAKNKDFAPEVKDNKKVMPDDVPSRNGYKPTDAAEIKEDMEYIAQILNSIKSEDYFNNEMFQGGSGSFSDIKVEDADFSRSNTDFSKNALSAISKFSELFANGLYQLRDEIYINEYIMGNFKNYTTGKTEELKNTELDIRGELMKDRPVFFDGNNADVEYIIWGNANESTNITAVMAQIVLIRFALNAISIYTDPNKVNMALQAATVVAGWTVFGVPIIHTLIMLAWAMAESVFDIYLLSKGESIPLFKTANNWITSPSGALEKLTEKMIDEIIDKAEEKIYESIDYLESEVGKAADNVASNVSNFIENRIDIYVDKAFETIENPLNELSYKADQIFKDFDEAFNKEYDDKVGQLLNELDNKVQELIPEQLEEFLNSPLSSYNPELIPDLIGEDYTDLYEKYKNESVKKVLEELKIALAEGKSLVTGTVEETSEKINSLIFNTINRAKKTVKTQIKLSIEEVKDSLVDEVKTTFKSVADSGREQIDGFFDSIGNTTKSGTMKSNLKASLLSMKYTDYLRLLLLFVNKELKMKRLADLIQVNMRIASENSSFMMSDCSTYIRAEAKVSMKYLFLSQPFVPKGLRTEDGKRIKFDIALYKGY